MSNIDMEMHTVVGYISGVTKPLSGQRLSVHNWKTVRVMNPVSGAIEENKRESVCVSLPIPERLEIFQNMEALLPAVVGLIQDTQDKMIREKLQSGKAGELRHVAENEIGIAACIEWLEAGNESGRITKESVVQWFDSEVVEMLMMELADKLGVSDTPTQEESDKIEAIVGEFRAKISSLAGGKTVFPAKIARQLKKAIELAQKGENDVLRERFIGRLDKMIEEPKENDLLGAL